MIPFYQKPLPYLTTAQMREVDRLMIEVYHIDLIIDDIIGYSQTVHQVVICDGSSDD